MKPLLFFVFLAALSALPAHAQMQMSDDVRIPPPPNTCATINKATAAGVLSDAVQLSITSLPKGTLCTFTAQNSASVLAVRVEDIADQDIHFQDKDLAPYTAHCRLNPTPVRGLGNEAFTCALTHAGMSEERMIGRVRDKLFVITLSSRQPEIRAALDDKLNLAAGQVVGNLF